MRIEGESLPSIQTRTMYGWKDSTLIYPIHIKIGSSTPVINIGLHIKIMDANDRVLIEGDDQLNHEYQAGQVYTVTASHKLNPFIPKEQEVDKLGAQNIKVKVNITSVTNGEGTTALLKDLPNNQSSGKS